MAIKSRIGEGTSVTVLPPAAAAGQQLEAAAASLMHATPFGRGEVLVVEDVPDVRHFATSTLLASGYEVFGAPDGEAALEVLRREDRLNLLFTDVVLPKGISGLGLGRRAQAQRPVLKVRPTSGYPEEANRRYRRPYEETPLLLKTYRRGALADAVARLLTLGTRSIAV